MRPIDGDALRDKLQNLGYDDWNQGVTTTWAEAFYECADIVAEAPTIEPEPHWIKCSERLPERSKDVLVTRDYDGREDYNKSCRYVEVASCYGEDDDITWNSFSDEYKMKPRNHHVIAWMPLPEPYKGGEG